MDCSIGRILHSSTRATAIPTNQSNKPILRTYTQIAGAGSAGCGVAAMLLQGFVEQGMNRERARKAFYMCDKDGLLGKARKDVRAT